ncbi:uncharacterized protein C2845_PM11G04940 [Panicum miliaceum]|uniref:Myb-like domain-containing protein n=1 Tax=Panicum miliaceum TaxID=4540 RepID=A0A3L6RU22_PANMI|nr:uncharacterized protein C2845_PM11G04940 [Panicum miliaceum]
MLVPPQTSPALAMPAPSAAAERLAVQWVADALAADDTIDFSVIKALVGYSSEFLVGAPDAARERVALRCLQELAAFTVSDEDSVAEAAAAPSRMLRVDAARSCEDLLIELTGQVGSSISFEKDRILPFRKDIQDFICIKKPTLPGTSLELLREVDPEIQSVVAPSPVDHNGITKHNNNQSLCNVNHLRSNVEKPRPPTVSTELQPENLTHVVNETEIDNFQQCPIKPTVDFDQPCASDIRFYNQPQEDAINAASVGASTTEKNLSNVDSDMSVAAVSAAVPASASCNATSQGNIVEPLSKKDMVDKTTVVQPQPCKGKSSNPNDDGACDQSLKDPSHGNQTVQATMAPAFDRTNDVLPTDTSEASHLVNQNLDGSASIPSVEKDPVHEGLTLRAASGIPSVTCNGAMQEDKSGTNHPSREHTTMFEEQIGTKSQLEVSCADQNNHTVYDDGTMLVKNTVCGGLNVQTAPESRSCNVTLHDKISDAKSLSEQNIETNTAEVQKRSCSISVPNSSHDGDRKRAKQDSKKQTVGKTVAETSHVHNADDSFSGFDAAAHLLSMTGKMPFCSQVEEANDCLGVSQEQDLCIKCGKDGQLLQCSSCLLSAHDSCFGSSVTFEDSGQFYCPNNSNQPHNSEKDYHVENTEAREDTGNGHSSHERRNSSQNRCTPAANPEVEADKEDVPTNSHQSEDSDEIEASSSNDSGKRSSPPWRTMKHHKGKPQEREATAASNSRKAFGQQDQHMPSPSGKRKYAYPPKRYSNPVAPTGRRSKLCWTEEEEAALRDAMEKFTPRDNGPIPWVHILEHGRNVFHKTRLPCDLRVKWRNMKKKAGS